MSLDNDETDRVLEEEHPGPSDLDSALVSITLSDVVEHTRRSISFTPVR
jgi:hypothetical protein